MGKIAEKAVCKSIFFDNIALYFECRINKNTLLQTVFFSYQITSSLVSQRMTKITESLSSKKYKKLTSKADFIIVKRNTQK